MHIWILTLINMLTSFNYICSSFVTTNISLCNDVPSTWSNFSLLPEIVVLREVNTLDKRMTSALDDADCWLRKNFRVAEATSVFTKGDNETICYSIATIKIKVKQLIVVISEGQSAQNCTPSIYGPIPNILNIKMFIDGTKNDSVRRMEFSYRNQGGHIGVQFELHRRSVVSKIQKTVNFMLQLNNQTPEYSKLVPFWNPTIFLPPVEWQYRKLKEDSMKKEMPISWVHVLSVMPMFFFGIVVSCYIVIQPRGGLTYTDEEVDFTIREVDSASRVNIMQPVIHAQKDPIKTVAISKLEQTCPDIHTALEPSTSATHMVIKTAIELETVSSGAHSSENELRESESLISVRSVKTVRLPLVASPSKGASSALAEIRSKNG